MLVIEGDKSLTWETMKTIYFQYRKPVYFSHTREEVDFTTKDRDTCVQVLQIQLPCDLSYNDCEILATHAWKIELRDTMTSFLANQRWSFAHLFIYMAKPFIKVLIDGEADNEYSNCDFGRWVGGERFHAISNRNFDASLLLFRNASDRRRIPDVLRSGTYISWYNRKPQKMFLSRWLDALLDALTIPYLAPLWVPYLIHPWFLKWVSTKFYVIDLWEDEPISERDDLSVLF